MLRPLLGSLLFVVIGVAIGVGLDAARQELSPRPEVEMEQVRRDRLLRYAGHMRALSVGNSHSLAVDFKAMDVPGYHVWARGQDLFEAEAQLHDLLPRLPNLEVVLFAVSYGSFRRDNGACDDEERGMVRSEWYASQPHLGLIGDDVENWFQGAMTRGLVVTDHWEPVLHALRKRLDGVERKPRLYRDLMTDDGQLVVAPGDFTPRSPEELDVDARDLVLPRHERLQENMLENSPDLEERAVACFERLVALLAEHEVRAIFYTPPYWPAYADGFDADTRRAMEAHMARFERELGVEYHDFGRDPVFVSDPANFVNSDHMSPVGARRFSRKRLLPLLRDG